MNKYNAPLLVQFARQKMSLIEFFLIERIRYNIFHLISKNKIEKFIFSNDLGIEFDNLTFENRAVWKLQGQK